MKNIKLALFGAISAAALSAASAASTTLTAWTFDNNSIGANAGPTPSTGIGSASAVGLGSSSNPDILSLSGSSTPSLPYSWRVEGTGGNIGWSTTAAIGSQGAQFSGSTAGYYQIQASFDVYATSDAEEYLQVQYTTEGTIWHNATITSVGTLGTIQNNSNPTNNLVVGSYLQLGSGWNTQVVVNLTGISGVDNCSGFAVRIVNAATGTNCLTTTGAQYNNTSGYWVFDNFVIQGVSYDTIADWTFDNIGKKSPVNNPAPAIANSTASAAIIGFNIPTNVEFANGVYGSTNTGDVTANGVPYSSTGAAGQYVWRLRGQTPGNGWLSTQPIGSQGAEFDVSTVNYSNVVISFDLYETSQGEAKMCVLYTTNAWTNTLVANNISYGLNPTLIQTNTTSANTVTGTYFNNTYGSIFFNGMVVDFTGDPTVQNNKYFGIRIVNAATGADCVNYLGQPYNNSSGNARVDNVAFSGQYEGSYAPVLTNSSAATVDAPFTNTFAISATDTNWVKNISVIYVNGVLLTNTAFSVTYSNIVFNPAKSAALQVSGLDSIVIYATNFTSAKVNQFVATGVAKQLAFTQPAGPSASSGTLTANPVFLVTDQYGNGTTNPYAAMTVTATVGNSSTAWTLGGSTVQPIYNGSCTFTDLTATLTGPSTVPNAVIAFTITGYTNTTAHTSTTNLNSSAFSIGAAPVQFTQGNLAVMQFDTLNNNTTFSVIELKPSIGGQTAPVNIVPISATGTNALRMAPAGSGGKLALSDDGTFLCIPAYQDGSSATPDETFNLNRAVATLNYTNGFSVPVNYVSTSYGGSQARAACSPDNSDFLIDDKGGLYVNNALVYQQNNISVRSFAGTAYALTAKVAYPPTPSFYPFVNGGGNPLPANVIDWADPGDNGPLVTASLTPTPDSVAQDFYMVATNLVYIADQSGGPSSANGIINKWMLLNDGITWTNIGSWTNADNCATLFAATNGNGGVYLYYANGSGGSGGNSIIRLTDQTIYGALNIISTNTIYTAPTNTSVAGITFVPNQFAYTNWLTPTPILTPQATAFVNNPFTITNTPDDATWRASITSVTVNGTTLSSSAYSTTQTGAIVFNPANSALLQSAGSKTIAFNATGYSSVSTVQVLNPSFNLGGVSMLAGGYLKLAFTNSTGLGFSVHGTNSLTAPLSSWPVIGHPVESPAGSGIYLFTNSAAGTNNQLFEIISQP